MGIYVGRSPSHASNVALILNPMTGHISPQFHVVFDDDFTTVPYLRKMEVPPHWAELVRSSAEVQLYTEHQVSTWQSLPEVENELGDFSYEQATATRSNQDSEGGILHTTQPLQQTKRVSFSDGSVRNEQEIISTTMPNTNSHNLWQMPLVINLDSRGLRCSSQAEVLNRRDQVYSHTTVFHDSSLQSASKQCFKTALVLFSAICSVGYGLPNIAHSLQVEVTAASTKGQDALLPGKLSSKRVLYRVSMMDDEIQSCKTCSE
jgi:hypothetical protein